MRATVALGNAARTPLIRFLGRRSVPRMSSGLSWPDELTQLTRFSSL